MCPATAGPAGLSATPMKEDAKGKRWPRSVTKFYNISLAVLYIASYPGFFSPSPSWKEAGHEASCTTSKTTNLN